MNTPPDIDEILRQETHLNAAGRKALADRILSAIAPVLEGQATTENPSHGVTVEVQEPILRPDAAELFGEVAESLYALPTPPVSTSAEKCAREIAAKTYVNDRGYLQSDVDENGIAAIIQRHFNGQGEDSALLEWLFSQESSVCRATPNGKEDPEEGTPQCDMLVFKDRSALRSAMSAQTQG